MHVGLELPPGTDEFHYSERPMCQQFRFASEGQSRSSRLLAERSPVCKHTLCRFGSKRGRDEPRCRIGRKGAVSQSSAALSLTRGNRAVSRRRLLLVGEWRRRRGRIDGRGCIAIAAKRHRHRHRRSGTHESGFSDVVEPEVVPRTGSIREMVARATGHRLSRHLETTINLISVICRFAGKRWS